MSEIVSENQGALAVQVDYDLDDSRENDTEPKENPEDIEIKTEHFEIGSELKADGQEDGVFVGYGSISVSYTHLRAHETLRYRRFRLRL